MFNTAPQGEFRWEEGFGKVHDLYKGDEFIGHVFCIESKGVYNAQWFYPTSRDYNEQLIEATTIEEAKAVMLALVRMS